jgi:hypothetical protein
LWFLLGKLEGKRMRKVQLLLVLVVAVIEAQCDYSPGIRGSGNLISESRTASGFTGVSLKGTGQVVIDMNGTESLMITADDNLLPYLTSEIKGDQLILGTKDNTNISPSKDVVYKVTAKNVDSIELGGSGDIDAKGINTDRLKILLGGSGNISIAGAAERQEITLAGSGNYRAEKLKSTTATINLLGSGDADLDASETLNVNIAGSGSVKYTGDARVTQTILGSGSVEKH